MAQSLDQLPTEILLHIGSFVDAHPKSLATLLPVSNTFNRIFSTLLYRNIWAIVASDEYFSRNCSPEGVREYIVSNGGAASYFHTTVITSLQSLRKLTHTLLSSPYLRSLVHAFRVNALDCDPADRTTCNGLFDFMSNFQEAGCKMMERKSHKLFMHKPYVQSLQSQIFEASMLDFFQEPVKRVNIDACTTNRTTISHSRQLAQVDSSQEKKGRLMDIDPSAVNMMLFCPYSTSEDQESSYCYVACIEEVRQLFEAGIHGEISVLSLQNMMMQSSLRLHNHQDELVFMSFMHYVIASNNK